MSGGGGGMGMNPSMYPNNGMMPQSGYNQWQNNMMMQQNMQNPQYGGNMCHMMARQLHQQYPNQAMMSPAYQQHPSMQHRPMMFSPGQGKQERNSPQVQVPQISQSQIPHQTRSSRNQFRPVQPAVPHSNYGNQCVQGNQANQAIQGNTHSHMNSQHFNAQMNASHSMNSTPQYGQQGQCTQQDMYNQQQQFPYQQGNYGNGFHRSMMPSHQMCSQQNSMQQHQLSATGGNLAMDVNNMNHPSCQMQGNNQKIIHSPNQPPQEKLGVQLSSNCNQGEQKISIQRSPNCSQGLPKLSEQAAQHCNVNRASKLSVQHSPNCNQVSSTTDVKECQTDMKSDLILDELMTPALTSITADNLIDNLSSISIENFPNNLVSPSSFLNAQGAGQSQQSSRLTTPCMDTKQSATFLDTSNMVVNDMNTTLSQLAEENRYFSMR
jgi:hypothetical protein